MDLNAREQTEEKLLEIEKSKVHVRGDAAEYWMYEKLREFFHGPETHENKDFLVFHGWKSNWLNKALKKLVEKNLTSSWFLNGTSLSST